MAYVLSRAAELYHYLNDEVSDPRVNNLLFMSSPLTVFVLLVAYLRFVLSAGPRWMRDRPAFNIDRLLVVYNMLQIVACLWLVYAGAVFAYGRGYCLTCQPVDTSTEPNALRIAGAVHAYFLLKVVDLLDTVFFVLRKKERQITFLHLYHHTGMVVLTWCGTKWFPGGHSVFTGFINSIVHIVMYAYYLLTASNPAYKSNVWWKKYITQMQIVQFFLITAHWTSLLVVERCGFPLWPAPIMISQNFLMLALFGDFYRKSYMLPKPKPTAAAAKVASTASAQKHLNDSNNNVNDSASEHTTTVANGSVTKRHQ